MRPQSNGPTIRRYARVSANLIMLVYQHKICFCKFFSLVVDALYEVVSILRTALCMQSALCSSRIIERLIRITINLIFMSRSIKSQFRALMRYRKFVIILEKILLPINQKHVQNKILYPFWCLWASISAQKFIALYSANWWKSFTLIDNRSFIRFWLKISSRFTDASFSMPLKFSSSYHNQVSGIWEGKNNVIHLAKRILNPLSGHKNEVWSFSNVNNKEWHR